MSLQETFLIDFSHVDLELGLDDKDNPLLFISVMSYDCGCCFPDYEYGRFTEIIPALRFIQESSKGMFSKRRKPVFVEYTLDVAKLIMEKKLEDDYYRYKFKDIPDGE